MLTRKFGSTKSVVAACMVTLSAVAGSGWVIGNAANAVGDAPAPATTAADDTPREVCPDGKVAMLDIERFPEAEADLIGAESVAAALMEVTTRSAVDAAIYTPFAAGADMPVWVTIGKATYVVNPTNHGGWFASPATLVACNSLDELDIARRPG